ncbi:MAG: hypothetical protein U0S48_16480 [Solirubrobacteraceae bacterium]
MFSPSQDAISSRTRVVDALTSERAPPMIPAIEVGPLSASSMSMPSAGHAAGLVVERDDLSSARAPHDEPAADDPVEVEGAPAGRSAASRSS